MTCIRTDIICRSSSIDVREVDKDVKNPWRWEWLEKEENEIRLQEVFRKINKCGVCYCTVCRKELAYGSRGFAALVGHMKSASHNKFLQMRKENFALPGKL
jgi:hypothetical protein